MTQRGSTLRLKFVLTDNWGDKVLYEEPITYEDSMEYKIPSYLDAFSTGVWDAIKDIDRTIESRNTLKTIPTADLIKELNSRSKVPSYNG